MFPTSSSSVRECFFFSFPEKLLSYWIAEHILSIAFGADLAHLTADIVALHVICWPLSAIASLPIDCKFSMSVEAMRECRQIREKWKKLKQLDKANRGNNWAVANEMVFKETIRIMPIEDCFQTVFFEDFANGQLMKIGSVPWKKMLEELLFHWKIRTRV